MKTQTFFGWIFSLAILFSFSLSSCTKEGPAGIAGKDGKDGEDGIDGQDGTATCVTCHNNTQSLSVRTMQWENSLHATGGHISHNNGECAVCHTSQGYRGFLNGTYDPLASGAKIASPNPPNCYTCHKIHDTYTTADLVLTKSGSVSLFNTNESVDFGKGSLCASCHQGRKINPFPVIGGPDVTITSPYYTLHHGTQANLVTGLGLVNIGEGLAINNPHGSITDQCVSCHMAPGTGAESGGHTMKMRNASNGLNTASCVGCHTNASSLNTNVNNLQAQVSGLLDDLRVKLEAKGILAPSGSPKPGTYSPALTGAFLNYKAISEDGSRGIHNPGFTVKLLQNSIAAVND